MTNHRRSFRANWPLNSIVLVGFIFAFLLVFFGGRLELALQQDTADVQRAMTEHAEVQRRFGEVIESEALPNPFDKGFAQLEKNWQIEKSGSTHSGYFTFRIIGEGTAASGRRITGSVKVYFVRTAKGVVEVTRIE
jgi:microcompartment protein CcmL/EutN